MLKIHYLNDSRAHRVLWLLEELGLEYEIQTWRRNTKTMLAPPEFKKVHALGKFPVVETDGLVLAESGAIIEYLAEREGALLPEGRAERADVRYWLHYAEGSLMPPLLMTFLFNTIKAKSPFFVRPLTMLGPNLINKAYLAQNLKTHMAFVEGHLTGKRWFAGDAFTAADIQMSFPLETSVSRVEGDFPAIRAWVKRVHARPAYQRALEKAGMPYQYA